MTTDLGMWVWAWLVVAVLIVFRQRRVGSVGLLVTYLLSFASLHWLTVALSLLPWYEGKYPDLTVEGLRQSTFALLAFAVGAEVASLWFRLRHPEPDDDARSLAKRVPASLADIYLITGILLYVVLTRVGASLPTINALVNAGSTLMVIGIAMKCWNAWHARATATMWRWFAVSAAFPIITVVTQGYLGYGFAAAATVFAFFASFYRPRVKLVVVAALLAYIGLSGYVTYMRDRRDIRAVVWGRGDMSDRFATLSDSVARVEWFDPYNPDHLARIETRLNQDYLIGAAVQQIESGIVPLAHGETLWDSMLGFIPRALWPNKPVAAGSGDLVSIYTGFSFGSETAVGVGHVLECYVNFGTLGIIAGFVLIGALVVLVDRSAHYWLVRGDVASFIHWYLPGLSLLNVGGSFVELTSSGAAALAIAILAKRLTVMFAPHLVVLPPAQWQQSESPAPHAYS